MIKVKNNIATREPLPTFLVGLAVESLADLSWTDPALGVSDAAWWPEEDASLALDKFEVYGDETLTIDTKRNVVVCTRSVQPMPQNQVDLLTAEKAAQVRSERNAKLSASDWTQVADAPVDKAAWAAYRQTLRDISTQTSFPWEVQWPEQPA